MISPRLLATFVILPVFHFAATAVAADKDEAWTDPESAKKEDPDFSIQGEYVDDGKKPSLGVQVVALGGGAFDAWFLEGGLPGAGWTKEKKRTKVTGKIEDGKVSFMGEGIEAFIEGGVMRVKRDSRTLELPRVERKSPTLGMKPPKDAIVLFDGTSADGWEKGKMENGLLASTGTTSEKAFGDCAIHLEFRTPYKPKARGQARGNSGVYYGGRWETQVLDSFGLEGKINETGGLYSIAPPKLNMCYPPLTWQTYDVDFTAAKFDLGGNRTAWPRITVMLNGVLIHEDQELNKTHTTAAPINGELKDEGGPIFLQAHGNPVYFRNIWVVPK